MKYTKNSITIQGRVYSFGEANGRNMLEVKTVKNEQSDNFGKEYISGTVQVAVDEAGLNVIPVHYTWVTPTTKAGGTNNTFAALKSLIDGGKTWVKDGKDAAPMVKLEPSFALNDFYVNENGEDRLVSSIVHEGGFATIVNSLPEKEAERTYFRCDMVITNVTHVDADEEKNIDEHVALRGAVFNFRKELLPLTFTVKNPNGMNYFEGLGVSGSEPVYTWVEGVINCNTVKNEVKEETAFGGDSVRTFEKKTKEWLVVRASQNPYDFGEEGILTGEELTKAMQDRQVKLAEEKKRSEEYKAQKNNPVAAPAAPKAKEGNFIF
jgi:hypothetical protein